MSTKNKELTEYFQKAIAQAPDRLKRVEEFKKAMEEQIKISYDLLLLEMTI